MREIKFRAWDRRRKKWVYFYLYEIVDINQESMTDDEWAFIQLENVGQYTGLKDKNGKEIYEGDIVRDQDGNLYQVKYTEYYIYPFGAIFPDKAKEVVNEYKCEVIGNIYENPELLEES